MEKEVSWFFRWKELVESCWALLREEMIVCGGFGKVALTGLVRDMVFVVLGDGGRFMC